MNPTPVYDNQPESKGPWRCGVCMCLCQCYDDAASCCRCERCGQEMTLDNARECESCRRVTAREIYTLNNSEKVAPESWAGPVFLGPLLCTDLRAAAIECFKYRSYPLPKYLECAHEVTVRDVASGADEAGRVIERLIKRSGMDDIDRSHAPWNPDDLAEKISAWMAALDPRWFEPVGGKIILGVTFERWARDSMPELFAERQGASDEIR